MCTHSYMYVACMCMLVIIYIYESVCVSEYCPLLQVNHIRNHLRGLSKPDGLYPNFLNPNTGNWGTSKFSLVA